MPILPGSSSDNPIIGAVLGFLTDLVAIIGLGLGGGQAAAAGELLALQQQSLSDHPNSVLSPEQLASAVVKGAIDAGIAADEARKSGFTRDNFQGLIDIAGNPPGPGQLFDLWNRDDIGADAVRKGLQEGFLRNEWIEPLMNLRRNLLNLGDLVAAVVQAQLTESEGADRAAMLGFDPSDFDLAVRTAGNPPGPMQTLTLLQRGEFTEAEAKQALRESRLKNKYIPALLSLVRRRVPARTITTMLHNGALDAATAHQYLLDLGYSDADATAYVTSAAASRGRQTHDLTVAQIKELYANRVMTRDTAVNALVSAGYTPEVAGQILALVDVLADHHVQQQAITNIRGRYISRRIDATQASAALDGIAVPADQRDHLLSVWAFEQEANHTSLTLAQITKAVKQKVMTAQEWSTRVAAMGYTDADVVLLGFIEGVTPLPTQGA